VLDTLVATSHSVSLQPRLLTSLISDSLYMTVIVYVH